MKNDERGLTRRGFIQGMAALGTLTCLAGCCTVSNLPKPQIDSNLLAIDPHCHIFNGRDLDIFNYVIADIPDYLDISLPIFYSITEAIRAFAPSVEQEQALLSTWVQTVKDQSDLKGLVLSLYQDRLQARREYLNSPALKEFLREHKRQLIRMTRTVPTLADKKRVEAEAEKHANAVLKKLNSPPVAALLEGLWHYRIVNAHRLMDDFPMMALFTPAMMDTDSWFQHRLLQPSIKSTSLMPQIDLYETIAILTNARFLPILAFDPRRQVEWKEGNPDEPRPPLDLVDECLRRGCFVGLKLYPPMGYRPANNAERDKNPPNHDWHVPLGSEMDAVLDSVFDKCIQTGMCTMAHTNRSQASDPDYLENGSPTNWRAALLRHPTLKINLAHFGGMEKKDDPEQWREGISCLMSDYAGVYADVADFTRITCRKTRNEYFRALKNWTDTHHNTPLLRRLMYGSDFYMSGLSPGYDTYAENWIAAFQEHFPNNWKDLVGGNAADFLGLRHGKQRERLDQFTTTHNLSPRWRALIGKA